jgi:hypothetical protein
LNVTVTVTGVAGIEKVHIVPVPVHGALNPPGDDPPVGVAVSTTCVPAAKLTTHPFVEPLVQLIPLPVTIPVPVPAVCTVNCTVVPVPVTVVEVVAVLLEGIGSGVLEVTLTVFVSVPAAAGVTTIVMVAVAPFAKVPRVQVTVVVPEQVPTEVDEETKLAPAGNTSVTDTLWAASGPPLETVIE